MSVKIISLSLPSGLIKVVDEQAKLQYSTRSEYIKRALITRLKVEGVPSAVLQPPSNYEETRKAKLASFLENYRFTDEDEYDDAE